MYYWKIDFRFNGRYVLFHIQCKIWSAGKYMFAWHWFISQVMYWSAQLCMSLVAWLTECELQNHNTFSICNVCGTKAINATLQSLFQGIVQRGTCFNYTFYAMYFPYTSLESHKSVIELRYNSHHC